MFNLHHLIRSGLVVVAAIAATAGAAQAQQRSDNDYNYIGGGVSDEGFVVNGKARIIDSVSFRPAAIIDYDFDDAIFLLPVTYDAPAFELAGSPILPFGGIGARVSTEDDTEVGLLLTGGADYRFSDRWTANGSLNVTFVNETDIDFTAGIGYTF